MLGCKVNFLTNYLNVMSPRSMNVVFTRIDFAIQKGLEVQLVVRLLSIQV